LACRCASFLSHETAGALWGLRPPQDDGTPIDVTVLGSATNKRAGIRIHKTRQLDRRDVAVRERLAVTSPARTLLDLAATLTTRELEAALDEALTMRITSRSKLAELLHRAPHRKAAPTLAALLAARGRSTVTRSMGEERFLHLVRAAGLPDPECNVPIQGFVVDALWRRQRLVVEVDSYQFHSSRSAFERDRRKDAALEQAGLEVARVSWDQMESEPYAVVARLARALARGRGA
jgi:very-short-patch-repair endonuclease